MALPKKKSRIILIDGIKYRWLLGPNDGYNVFVAQKEGVEGRTILVYFRIDDLNPKIIKPKDSETIIRQALQLGWDPEEKGNPVVFDLAGDKLLKREKQR